MEDREVRTVTAELRADDSGGLVGYAAKYDVWSVPLMGFKERIAKGAFDRALKEQQDVRALWNHDSNFVLGRSTKGTLEMETDDIGLRVRIKPPDAQWARDLMESVKRGDIDQMSFGFRVVTDQWWQEKDSEEVLRELRDVDLYDVSPVTFPAYPQTSLSARDQHLMVAARKAQHGMVLTNEERDAVEQIAETYIEHVPEQSTEVEDEPADAGVSQRTLLAFAKAESRRYEQIRRRHA